MEILASVDPYAGKYFSSKWIKQNVLRQSSDEQEEIEKQIKEDGDKPENNQNGEDSTDTQKSTNGFDSSSQTEDDIVM